MFVFCKLCDERHQTDEVEFVDCCEGDCGQDVMTFVCPVKQEETESNVYRG